MKGKIFRLLDEDWKQLKNLKMLDCLDVNCSKVYRHAKGVLDAAFITDVISAHEYSQWCAAFSHLQNAHKDVNGDLTFYVLSEDYTHIAGEEYVQRP